MVRYERFVNNVTTTTNGSITDAATSVTVTDGSGFPSEGDFRISIANEILLVTARASNVLTVVRGQEGTTAAAHGNGSTVKGIVTAGGLERFARDFLDPFAPERQNRLLDVNGNVLTSSDFTWGNQGTSSVVDEADGSLTLRMEGRAAPNLVGLYRTAPATPYTLTVHLLAGVGDQDVNANIIGFRESATSKLEFMTFNPWTSGSTKISYTDWNNSTGTTAGATYESGSRYDVWARIEDDGTNLKYYTSSDGYNFFEHESDLRGNWFTTGPDQIWWGGDNPGNDNEATHLLSWVEA